MLTKNLDVEGGQANGTRCLLSQVLLKQGAETFPILLDGGVPVAACFASDVSHGCSYATYQQRHGSIDVRN